MVRQKVRQKQKVVEQPVEYRELTVPERLLVDLVRQAYESGALPEPDDVSSQIGRYMVMDVPSVIASLTNNRLFVTYKPIVFNIVSTMSDKEVANTLISSLDKYYHDIIEQIYSDDRMTTMFVDVFKGVLGEVRNA